ncbi:MAG: hypothetical protein ACK5UE_09850 [Chitinophagales bacterium]|jgi:hypothetical protein|nr:hypothetical protein [Sphingobacteriales bacterium]
MSVNRILFSVFFVFLLVLVLLATLTSKKRAFLLNRSVSISINGKPIPASVVTVNSDQTILSVYSDSLNKRIQIGSSKNFVKKMSAFEWRISAKMFDFSDPDVLFTFALYLMLIMTALYFWLYAIDDYTFIRDLIRNRTKVPLSYYSEEELENKIGDLMTCHHCGDSQKMKLIKETFQDSMQMIKLVCTKCGYEKDARVDKV